MACNKDDDKVAIKFAIKDNKNALKALNDEINVYEALEKMQYLTKCINIVKRVKVETLNIESNIDTNIDTTIYLALERCDTDLDAFVRKNTYDISDITKQLFNGLLFLYKNNILHLDLKPANILVMSDGDKHIFKISDFGMAKIYKDISSALHKNVSCGTICYMPATNVNKLSKTTFFRDLYAFFCIIYFVCYLQHYNSASLASQAKTQLLIDKINIPELDDNIIIYLINLQDALIKNKSLSINSHDKVTTNMLQKNNKNNKNNKIVSTPELYEMCYDTINNSLNAIEPILSTTIPKKVITAPFAVDTFDMHS